MATASKTTYLEQAIINHVLRNTAYTSPTTVYVALFTADPTKSGDQSNEVSGGGYARQAVTFGAPDGNGKSSNSSLIQFPQATASWGTITHVGIMDASTAGNILYQGAADASKAVGANDVYQFEAGQLAVEED